DPGLRAVPAVQRRRPDHPAGRGRLQAVPVGGLRGVLRLRGGAVPGRSDPDRNPGRVGMERLPPAEFARPRAARDEQVRSRGLRLVASVEDMARDDVFESDEELDEFLAYVYAERHANLT